jgi:hypothetical protein
MKAVIEAMYLLKTDRALALRLIKKYIRVNDDEAAIGYDYYLARHGEESWTSRTEEDSNSSSRRRPKPMPKRQDRLPKR